MGSENNSSSIYFITNTKPFIDNCSSTTGQSNPYILNPGYSEEISSFIIQTYSIFIFLFVLTKTTRVKSAIVELISEVVLINLTVLLISPVLVLLTSGLFAIRCFIKLYLLVRYSGKVNLISNSDSFWACDSYINTNYIYAQLIAEGDCTVEQFQTKMSNALELHSSSTNNKFVRMKCKISKKLGYFCWEYDDGNFNIQNHVRDISPNPSESMNEKQILEQISRTYDNPMPDNRPKWEVQFIPKFKYENVEGTNKKNYYSFIWKLNHVYMDGVSITNVLNWYIADQPVEMSVDPFKPLNVSLFQWILIYLKLALLGPHSFVKAIFVKEDHCFHGPTLTGPKTLSISRPINLNALKAIKDKQGTSVSAVSISLVGGAIRRLALRKGLPVPDTIHTAVTSAMIPYKDLQPINRFTIAHMPISIGSKYLSERLKSAGKSAYDLSRSVEFLLNFKVVRFIGLLPAAFIKWFIDQTHCSLIFSNVPGPKGQLLIDGLPVKDLISWNVIKGSTGLGVCLISCGGRIRAGIIGDAAVFTEESDMDSLIEEFENEMVDLALMSGISKDSIFSVN